MCSGVKITMIGSENEKKLFDISTVGPEDSHEALKERSLIWGSQMSHVDFKK